MKAFIHALIKKEGKALAEIRIIFCDKKEMREINKRFLSHDYDTDIITFPYSKDPQPIDSELYINIPVIKKQAVDYQCSFQEELHRIIFHGILHLCGYNDKAPGEISIMREKETLYLKKYFS